MQMRDFRTRTLQFGFELVDALGHNGFAAQLGELRLRANQLAFNLPCRRAQACRLGPRLLELGACLCKRRLGRSALADERSNARVQRFQLFMWPRRLRGRALEIGASVCERATRRFELVHADLSFAARLLELHLRLGVRVDPRIQGIKLTTP